MKIFKRTLQPGTETVINHTGRFIRGIGGASRYQIAIDQGQKTDFETGIAYESPRPFSQVTLRNTSAEQQVIEIAIADGFVADNRMVGRMDVDGFIKTTIDGGLEVTGGNINVDSGNVTVDGAVSVTSGNVIVDSGNITVGGAVSVTGGLISAAGCAALQTGQLNIGTTAANIASANANRRSVLISASRPIWIGGPGVTKTTGFPVTGAITLETTAALYAVADNTTTVYRLEEIN